MDNSLANLEQEEWLGRSPGLPMASMRECCADSKLCYVNQRPDGRFVDMGIC